MRSAIWLPAVLVLLVVAIVGGIILMPVDEGPLSDSDEETAAFNEQDPSELAPPSLEGDQGSIRRETDSDQSPGPSVQSPGPSIANRAAFDTGTGSPPSVTGDGSGDGEAGQSPASSQAASGLLQGTVQDTGGRPLSGVELTLAKREPVLTQSDGGFTFSDITEDSVTLTAEKSGFQPLEQTVRTGNPNLTLVMVKEGMLAGRVLDQKSEPVAYAQVDIEALQGIWIRNLNADRQGRFSVENAPQAKVRIEASQEGYDARGGEIKEVESPHPSEVILRLHSPSFYISGRVINQSNNQPVSGFALSAKLEDGAEQEAKTTSSQGNGLYRFDELTRGTYIVSSVIEQNAAKNLVVPIEQDDKNVRVYENSVDNVDFLVRPGREVRGTVVDFSGQPAANARVFAAPLGAPHTFTNADGTYRLTGVPMRLTQGGVDTSAIRISAEHDELGTGVSKPLPNESESSLTLTGIDITLQSAGSVVGQVVDSNQAGVAGARVTLVDNVSGKTLESETGAAGNFQFTDVPTSDSALSPIQGTHTLQAMKENFGSTQKQVVIMAEVENEFTLTLDGGGAITGRAVDEQGHAVANARVTTWLPTGQSTQIRTDPNGFYEFPALPDGTYDLQFRLPGQPPLTGNLYGIEAGRSNANAVLMPNEWIITGTVINQETGEPLPHYEIQMRVDLQSAEGKGFSQTRTINTPDGTYQISVYEEGLYTLNFYADGYSPTQGQVRTQITNRGRQFLNIQMPPAERFGTVRGTLQPPPGKELVAVRIGGRAIFPTNGNAFHIEQVPEGKNQLYFYIADAGGGVGNEMAGALTITVNADQIKNLGTISPERLIFIRQ